MSHNLILAFSLSIAIAAVTGLIRLKKIDKAYYPFLFLLWLGLANELLSIYLVQRRQSNAVNNNIYYLLESILITFQFRNWKLFEKNFVFYGIIAGFILCWTAETLVFRGIREFASWFIIFHSFVIALMSISMFNKILVRNKRNLLANSIFIICIGFIVFFTYATFIELFWMYDEGSSKSFRTAVSRIMAFINLFANLIFIPAVLWMPRRQGYTLS